MKIFAVLVHALLIACATSTVYAQGVAQSQRGLGRPATQVYQPEPNVIVTVNYDRAGKICDIQMKGTLVKLQKLLDKLVPLKTRGRLLHPPKRLIDVADCCESWLYEHERVIISDFFGNDMDNLRVIFKNRKCAIPTFHLSHHCVQRNQFHTEAGERSGGEKHAFARQRFARAWTKAHQSFGYELRCAL